MTPNPYMLLICLSLMLIGCATTDEPETVKSGIEWLEKHQGSHTVETDKNTLMGEYIDVENKDRITEE